MNKPNRRFLATCGLVFLIAGGTKLVGEKSAERWNTEYETHANANFEVVSDAMSEDFYADKLAEQIDAAVENAKSSKEKKEAVDYLNSYENKEKLVLEHSGEETRKRIETNNREMEFAKNERDTSKGLEYVGEIGGAGALIVGLAHALNSLNKDKSKSHKEDEMDKE